MIDDDLTPVERERVEAGLRRRRWLLLFAVVVVPLGAIAELVISSASHSGRAPKHPVLFAVVLTAVPIVLVALLYPLVVRQYRRAGPVRRLVASGSRQDLRRVGKALRTGQVIAAEDRETASAILGTYRRQEWLAVAAGVLAVANLGLAIGEGGATRWLRLLSGGAYLIVVVIVGWTIRRVKATAAAQGITADPPAAPPGPRGTAQDTT